MSSYVHKQTPGDSAWFTHDRFGMFIHWGLYSMPARHEWIKSTERIPEDHYDLYFKYFNPDLYDPKEWARQAKAAGMKYAVLTTKHHEGFCMFDSQYTDYKCTNTPAGRDLVREYVDAFRAEGLHVGFYYSLIDWHHPDFPLDTAHPRSADPDAERINEGRDMHKYAEYMRNQVTELLTNYGKIDILWFDFSYGPRESAPDWMYHKGAKGKEEWEAEELIATARKLQRHILIDNRTQIEQDLWTPEQCQMTTWPRHPETNELVLWEACQTFSGSWGYHRDEMTWKSPEMLIQMLINTVSLGGNLLMNVGPSSRGYQDNRAEAALKAYADWMKYNSRSIYGCTMPEPELLKLCPPNCKMTQSVDGKRLYLHLYEYPYNLLHLPGFEDKVEYAQFLHDGSELRMRTNVSIMFDGGNSRVPELTLTLPVVKPNVIIPVIELFLK